MRNWKKSFQFDILSTLGLVSFLAAQFLSCSAHASLRDDSSDLDLDLPSHVSHYKDSHVQRVLSADDLALEQMNLKTPVDLQNYNSGLTTSIENAANPNSDNHAAASHLLDQNVNRILKSQKDSGNVVGGAAHLQSAMQTNLSLGGADGSIKHSVNFRINAASGSAMMNYTGYLNAQLTYDISHDGALKAAIIQKLDRDTNLVIDHTTRSSDRIDRLSVAWIF
jgi:hypothetical protein